MTTEYEKDLSIPCPVCLAEMGKDCNIGRWLEGEEISSPGVVHINRRIKRLLIEKRPDLLEPTN